MGYGAEKKIKRETREGIKVISFTLVFGVNIQ